MIIITINNTDYNELKKELKDDVSKCYGALCSFQTQIHGLVGTIEEAHLLLQSLLSVFNDMSKNINVITKGLKK